MPNKIKRNIPKGTTSFEDFDKVYNQEKWDKDFLDLAEYWAKKKSKDPSTQVGAVIARGKDFISIGYNGFPKGVRDLPERYNDRETKYKFVCHAEPNALVLGQGRLDENCTIYTWPLAPCHECAKLIIQFRIKRVVVPSKKANTRWNESNDIANIMFEEAGVKIVEYDME